MKDKQKKHQSSCMWLQFMQISVSWYLGCQIVESVAHSSPKLECSSAFMLRMECLLDVTCHTLFAVLRDTQYSAALHK